MDPVAFLKAHIPEAEQGEIPQELRKTLKFNPLSKQKKPNSSSSRFSRNKHGFLTARARRELGLFRLLPRQGQEDLKYEDFKELRSLWTAYLRDLLDLEHYVHPKDSLESSLQIKLCRADYHGANLCVTRSPCKTLMGLKGTVLMETRNAFQLITRKNELKVVPKKGSSFSFECGEYVFTLSGANMCCKPSERAVKKWKNKVPYDF